MLPPLFRIDVVDRQGGPVRTVVQSSEEDLDSGGATIDSIALFGGKVYWITRDSYTADTGTIRSYDLNTGAVADVSSGAMRNVKTTAAGLAWDVTWGQDGTRAELKIPDQLPPPVAGALGTGQDQMTLATDGTAYAWFTGTDQGGTGVAWWSPTDGLVRITRKIPDGKNQVAPLYVVGPYVVLDTRPRGREVRHLRDGHRHPLGCVHLLARVCRRCRRRDDRGGLGRRFEEPPDERRGRPRRRSAPAYLLVAVSGSARCDRPVLDWASTRKGRSCS